MESLLPRRQIMGKLFSGTCCLLLALAGWVLICSSPAVFAATPPAKVFRIAYLETGPYWSFSQALQHIRDGLRERGWEEKVEFPEDLYFSLGWGSEDQKLYRQKVHTILQRKDFDLLICMGLDATRTVLAENDGRIPIVGVEISRPLSNGIVKSPTDSGAINFTTALNQESGRFMFLVFHQLVGFRRLGIMYHDSPVGRSYGYVDDARETGRDVGFEVVEYNRLGVEEPFADCLAGLKDLHDRGADAIFIPNLNCFDLSEVDPTPFYRFAEEKKLPTFAADDREQVRHFALMGMNQYDPAVTGKFHAQQIIDILSGKKKPGELAMTAPYNYRVFLNLETAEKVGVEFEHQLLITADQIFIHQEPLKKDQTGKN